MAVILDVIIMNNVTGNYFLLDESSVAEINSILAKYNNCAECMRSGRQVNRNGGCEGCDLSMTNDEGDAGWALHSAFEECMSLGFMTGGKKAGSIDMEDVPSDVWDEVYAKWKLAIELGWRNSMWHGCSLCDWMADTIGVDIMREVDCEMCPLYEYGWCVSIPDDSKLHMDYVNPMQGSSGDGWRIRVEKFLMFVKPHCSRDGEGMLREDVINCIMKYDGMIDVVGISLSLGSHSCDMVGKMVDELEKEGIVRRHLDVRGIYSFSMVNDKSV